MTQIIKQESALGNWNPDQIEIIKKQIAKGASDAQLALFAQVCQRTGLDPFSRQIYCIMRGGNPTIQVSIDGFRTIAARSGLYGGSHTEWCGDDGIWRDVWLGNGHPAAAKTTVYRIGSPHPFTGVAIFKDYDQKANLWLKMPAIMIAKCSESLALRKAFPAELSGLYTTEEYPSEEPRSVPTTDERIKELKTAVRESIQVLGWNDNEQREWANNLHGRPSSDWSMMEWSQASVSLQEEIDREGRVANLVEAGEVIS